MSALKYWIWLASLPNLSNQSKLHLLAAHPAPEDLYYASAQELYGIEGVKKEQADLLDNKSMAQTESILEACARENIFIVTMTDALYPSRLHNIFDPPILLYGKGRMPVFDEEAAISVVGTRDCTPYGIQCAQELGYELTRQGAMIVSGMARGIDSAALQGALRGGGFTCAVLGGGVDAVYPAENRRLYEDIVATGVVLSEYAPGEKPESWHFPQRNRIMSGLTLGTLVVEAPEKSGALITARNALEQGRDVFAVPGPIGVDSSAGCHQLIRQGAMLVTNAWDILEEYSSRYPKLHRRKGTLPPLPQKTEKVPENPAESTPPENTLPTLDLCRNREGLTDDQIAVMRLLSNDTPMLTDEVAEAAGISIRRILSALTVLEIDGFVKKTGAQSFVSTVTVVNDPKKEK